MCFITRWFISFSLVDLAATYALNKAEDLNKGTKANGEKSHIFFRASPVCKLELETSASQSCVQSSRCRNPLGAFTPCPFLTFTSVPSVFTCTVPRVLSRV